VRHRRVILIVGLFLVFLGAPVGAARITNEPTGFNGYTWGASVAQLPGLTHVVDPKIGNPLPYVDVYEKPGEVLTLNGVTFSSVLYRFYKHQLGGIQLTYVGRENREKLIQWIGTARVR